jgi:hypothetical protein
VIFDDNGWLTYSENNKRNIEVAERKPGEDEVEGFCCQKGAGRLKLTVHEFDVKEELATEGVAMI